MRVWSIQQVEAFVRLADFIETQRGPILGEWVSFAASCAPVAFDMAKTELRDHASQMLDDIVADLRSYQSERQRKAKSLGATDVEVGHSETAAETHGAGRAISGFTVEEMTSEYRALRASVLRLWTAAQVALTGDDIDDLMRFNEAIDQGLAESMAYHAGKTREMGRTLWLSEQRYSILLREMAEGVLLYNAEQRIELWNPAAERLLGLTSDQLAGKTAYGSQWQAFDAAGVPISFDAQFAGVAMHSGERTTGMLGVRHDDGSRVWLQLSAAPLVDTGASVPYAVEVTLTDVTAEREATRLLAESEERYRMLASNSVDLVSRQTPTGRFEYVSPSYTTVLGWRDDQLLGEPADAFVHVDDAEAVRNRIATLTVDAPVRPLLVRARHVDGQFVWMESVGTPITGDDGAVVAVQVAERNVNERSELEARLRQAHKMEALGRMANGVAHDFNNQLMVVRATCDVLRADSIAVDSLYSDSRYADSRHADSLQTDERIALLNAIDASVDRAAQLTMQLLAFSQGTHFDPETVAVGPLMRRARGLLLRTVGSRTSVTLSMTAEAESSSITAEAEQIEQVLLNVLMNADDVLTSGGVISLHGEVERVEQDVVHRHGIVAAGTYVVMRVVDRGAGMTDDVLARLFDPFYTTKPQGRGVGMGLSAVFGIVQKAGGAIVVQSELGQGTTVSIYWPQRPIGTPHSDGARVSTTPAAATRPAPAPLSSSPIVIASAPSADVILVVDDDPAVRMAVARLLERDGYVALSAESGAAGLALAAREHATLDAIVSDVRMPGMSGVEMVAELLTRGIDLPVLFMSGQLDAELPADWPTTARRNFIGKPFSASALSQAMRELLSTVAS